LNVSKAAVILKVRRATLSDLLAGKAALSPEMALRIEKAFGPEMDDLLRMQLANPKTGAAQPGPRPREVNEFLARHILKKLLST
jgi:plasmid maintenance system antidote protein VapI